MVNNIFMLLLFKFMLLLFKDYKTTVTRLIRTMLYNPLKLLISKGYKTRTTRAIGLR